MAQIFFSRGTRTYQEFKTEDKYLAVCQELTTKYGNPYFEMPWPNKKVFKVFRDKQDNEIEVLLNLLTINDVNSRLYGV